MFQRLVLTIWNILHIYNSLIFADGEYKMKYEKAMRDFNFKLKKKSQEHDDEVEELLIEKKSLERKVNN